MNRILIIEDDEEICLMIKDHLEKYNYHVYFISTVANAVEQVSKFFIIWCPAHQMIKNFYLTLLCCTYTIATPAAASWYFFLNYSKMFK